MSTPKSYLNSVAIDKGMWVSGGYSKTTDLVFLNGTTVPGPLLPQKIYGHCMVKHEGIIYIIGGQGSRVDEQAQKIMKFDEKTLDFIGNGPKLNIGRKYISCGIFQSTQHQGRPILVVSNGLKNGIGFTGTSEILDLTLPGSEWVLSSK